MNGKEIAKFLSGLAVNQALTHGAFAASSVEFRLFGVLYDRTLNSTAAVIWAAVAVLLVYYAWIKR